MMEANVIHTEAKPVCLVCGQQGILLYSDLHDRLFGAPGTWTLKRCVGEECRTVWLDPAPREDELWKAYSAYYTHGDDSLPHANTITRAYHFVRDCYLSFKYGYFASLSPSRLRWLGLAMYLFPGRRADVDFSVMYLQARPQARLLEIGCGSGRMLNIMKSLGWKAEGIDFDATAVANARGKGLDVRYGTLSEQGYADASFDAIIMSHVIEHVPDPKGLLVECHRILKPGGVLSMVTPNIDSFGSRFFGHSWLHLDPPRHLILYNSASLHNLAQRAGFSDVATRTVIRDAHSLFWASYSISRRGTFLMGSQPGGLTKLALLALRFAEWWVIKLFPQSGEEIALSGFKR